MRYNENFGIEINGKTVITEEIDDNPIFEISCVVIGDLEVETVKANYDLVIVGKIDAQKIEINGNFSCMGECACEEIAIQGSCTIDGNLYVTNGFVGDNLIAKEICADVLEIKGSVKCSNLECNEDVKCDQFILVSEGLTGSGRLTSEMTLCGEYSLLEDTNGVFIADSMKLERKEEKEERKTEIINVDDELKIIREKAQTYDSLRFGEELDAFVERHEKYKNEANIFTQLVLSENISSVPNIKYYVDVIDIINRKYFIISYSKAYEKVKKRFESFTYEDINHSVMPSISQKEFAKMIYVLIHRGQYFSPAIRTLLIETLYTYVGIDEDVFRDTKKTELKEEKTVQTDNKKPVEIKNEEEFFPGDEVMITQGVWNKTRGVIKAIHSKTGKVDIVVSLFDRKTLISIPINQIKKK